MKTTIYEGKTDCSPKDIGYDPKALDTLDGLCRDLIEAGVIQSACYLLARRGKVFAHKSAGKLTKAKDSPDFQPDSLRPTASLTKAFTAAGVWQLMERGKIHLFQAVSSIIKEFDTPLHRDINLFQLLTHTSGLKTASGSMGEPYPAPWDESIDRGNWIRKGLTGPLQFPPGTVWNYCTFGFMVLAEVISRVSGMDYDKYIEKNLFEPLGMKNTFYFLPAQRRGDAGSISPWNDWTIKRKRDKNVIIPFLGGGGAISNVRDIYAFGQTLLNGGVGNGTRVLGRKTVEAGTKAQVKDMPCHNWQKDPFGTGYPVTYGLGLEINKHPFLTDGTFDHEGAGGVFLYMDPKEDFVFSGFMASPDYHAESWVRPLAVAWSGIE